MAADSIGTSIRKRRQILGMKQGDLARAVGVSESTVSNWEQGKHFPLRYLGRIEQVLGISLDEDAEEPLEIPDDLQEYIDGLTDRQREYFIDRLRAGQEARRLRSRDHRRSAG